MEASKYRRFCVSVFYSQHFDIISNSATILGKKKKKLK